MPVGCQATNDPVNNIPIELSVVFVGMPNGEAERTEVLRGTLDRMVLRTLVSLGPSHGYAIAARIEQVSDGALLLNSNTCSSRTSNRSARATSLGSGP